MSQIDQYLKEIKGRLSDQTVAKYVDRLERFDKWRKQHADTRLFTKKVARDFLIHLQDQQFAASTVAYHLSTVSAFYSWLEENEIIEYNPLRALKRKFHYRSKKKPAECMFTIEEYERLKAHCDTVKLRFAFWKGAIIIGWNTALRMADIANLEWSEVNIIARKIKLTPQKTQRAERFVEIPILPELHDFLSTVPMEGAYILPAMQREYAKTNTGQLSVQFSRICKGAGIEGKTFHGLRHTLASRLLNHGVPASIVSGITGQSLQTLQRYSHVRFEDSAAIVQEALAS